MLWTIVAVLVVLWLLGFVTNIVGGLIHLVLVVALIVLAYNFLSGRRSRLTSGEARVVGRRPLHEPAVALAACELAVADDDGPP